MRHSLELNGIGGMNGQRKISISQGGGLFPDPAPLGEVKLLFYFSLGFSACCWGLAASALPFFKAQPQPQVLFCSAIMLTSFLIRYLINNLFNLEKKVGPPISASTLVFSGEYFPAHFGGPVRTAPGSPKEYRVAPFLAIGRCPGSRRCRLPTAGAGIFPWFQD